jgi:8-oxo-dGTP pyrophosphatase MutT (NUDIX family)
MKAMSRRESLLDELRSYLSADAAESRNVEAVIDLLTTSADPFSRASFEPGHITASCFIADGGQAILPVNRTDRQNSDRQDWDRQDCLSSRLLLHHHRRLGRWLQMGGHVEAEESVADAALREGREESGLADLLLVDGIFDVDVHAIPAANGDPLHQHFDVRYLLHTAAPDAAVLDPHESNDLLWVTLDRAEALMNAPESSRVIRKLERLIISQRSVA